MLKMFGEILREARNNAFVGISDLARRVGMDQPTLSKIEAGVRMAPPLEKIVRIVDELRGDADLFVRFLDAAAEPNGNADARLTEEDVARIKNSQALRLFFTY
jgi:transcriptional regulator with XRE-family HTH domain